MIDKMGKNPNFSPILKWKHTSIWQLFWCDGKLPFDDYELYYIIMCFCYKKSCTPMILSFSLYNSSISKNIFLFGKQIGFICGSDMSNGLPNVISATSYSIHNFLSIDSWYPKFKFCNFYMNCIV